MCGQCRLWCVSVKCVGCVSDGVVEAHARAADFL